MDEESLAALARVLSHDLRAPLRAVDGYARMVLDEEGQRLTDEGRRKLEASLAASAQLSRQIDAVVAYLRTVADPARFAPVDMGALVGEQVALLRSGGRLAGVEVEVGPLPPAFGDRDTLRELWKHLLDNAAKFSAKVPAPRIGVAFEADREGGWYVVGDNGAGFDPRHAGKLFGLFQRLHYADEFAGIGAGLAICLRVVDLHGGSIRAESEPGKGASLRFSLPVPAGAGLGRSGNCAYTPGLKQKEKDGKAHGTR
jgi:light-regulated signal transduction histidine kinase (bacteriophytochrome)